MAFLTDNQLVDFTEQAKPIIHNLERPKDWYSLKSPIQPCSIDLHIGNIFLPGCKDDERGGAKNPLSEHVLSPGSTAVVVTKEQLSLPKNLTGIGFPPAHVSSKGLLMTNPGLVDPGYQGSLHCTVINMSRVNFALRSGDDVITILVAELSGNVRKDYEERAKAAGNRPAESSYIVNNLSSLSVDFLDVNQRADKIAKAAVHKIQFYASVIPVLITVIGSLLLNSISPSWREAKEQLNGRIAAIEERMKIDDLRKRIDSIEDQEKNIQAAILSLEEKMTAQKR